ncbi:hypothetical protein DRE_00120 [Drechslerella stenobrocha 248]|uniref:F-box domain-containing protein n=1 Tax=Drechslerella stenobrocha 248 TaxID=1043628 RepID=W7IHS0_9PEZI|nr:hypothetical protein DRE_00120 [Drechslerella stenobrocha 248]
MATILCIPVEIQREIFRYLPAIRDQIAIDLTCTLWRAIMQTSCLRRARYYDNICDPNSQRIHAFLRHTGNEPSPRLNCAFKDGAVHSYQCCTSPDGQWKDVTHCSFMDELMMAAPLAPTLTSVNSAGTTVAAATADSDHAPLQNPYVYVWQRSFELELEVSSEGLTCTLWPRTLCGDGMTVRQLVETILRIVMRKFEFWGVDMGMMREMKLWALDSTKANLEPWVVYVNCFES